MKEPHRKFLDHAVEVAFHLGEVRLLAQHILETRDVPGARNIFFRLDADKSAESFVAAGGELRCG